LHASTASTRGRGLADFFERQLDAADGLVYCASPSGAFLGLAPTHDRARE